MIYNNEEAGDKTGKKQTKTWYGTVAVPYRGIIKQGKSPLATTLPLKGVLKRVKRGLGKEKTWNKKILILSHKP